MVTKVPRKYDVSSMECYRDKVVQTRDEWNICFIVVGFDIRIGHRQIEAVYNRYDS